VQGAAVKVDIPSVRFVADGGHVRPGLAKKIRRQSGRRSIAAVDHEPHAVQSRSNRGKQKIDVRPDVIRQSERRDIGNGCSRLFENAEDLRFDIVLFRIGQLVTRAGK
jgi:hypothetical protein